MIQDIAGSVIYCDDVRSEINGKFSFIGCYQGSLVVHGQFPFTLPKFGIAVTYHERAGSRSQPVILRIYFPGDPNDSPSIEGEIPIEIARQAKAPDDSGDYPGDRYLRYDEHFILAPLVLKSKGLIKARFVCGDDVLAIGSLRIEQQIPDEPTVTLQPADAGYDLVITWSDGHIETLHFDKPFDADFWFKTQYKNWLQQHPKG